MDRDDAAFVANALDSRISNERAELERLAASSLMRLSACATSIARNAADWPPAKVAAREIMAICRHGGAVCDQEPDPALKIVVDKLRELAAEPVVAANRHGRRQLSSIKRSSIRRARFMPPQPELGRQFH